MAANSTPGTYDLEVQKSLTGMGDGDFSPLALIEQVTTGEPFEVEDSPVPPGQFRIYRARHVCRADPSVFSDWAYTIGRGAYPGGEASMSELVTSATSALAISDAEGTYGHACRAVSYLDFRTHELGVEKAIAESSANRNTVAEVSDEGSAITRVSGSASLDFRPGGGLLKLLTTRYVPLSTLMTTIAAVVGPPVVPEHYKNKLILSAKRQKRTIIAKEGDWATVYGGVEIARLRYSADKTQTGKIGADVDLVALNSVLYDAETADQLAMLSLDTAGYDLLTGLNPTDWVLYIDGVAAPCQQHSVDFNFNPGTKDVGNNHLGASAHYSLKSQITGTMNLYFESKEHLLTYFGLPANTQLPAGVSKKIQNKEIKIVFGPPTNEDNYSNEVALVLPVCSFRTLTRQIPENGPVMLAIGFKPKQDPSQGRIDHYWEFTNGETFTNLTTLGREILYAPKQDLFPYYGIPGVASGAPTTTVVASAAQYLNTSYLSAVDDTYNGKQVRFVTGANAGQVRTISDYTGATRTFTLSVALPQAPAAGDQFQVLNAEKA